MTVSRMNRKKLQAAEAQRVADLDRVALHLHRVQVVQHRVHDHVGAVARAVGVALAEDRAGPEDRAPAWLPCTCRRRSFGGAVLAPSGSRLARRWSLAMGPVVRSSRTACRSRSRGCWCAGGGRRRGRRTPTLPRMITPVGQRSTHSAQRVQTSSSMMKTTWSLGSSPGLLGADRLGDGVGGDHVDALPRADVDAALAHDALGLVDVDELLRLDRLRRGSRRRPRRGRSRPGTRASADWRRCGPSLTSQRLLHQRTAVGGGRRARRRRLGFLPRLLPPQPHDDVADRGRRRR